MNCNFVENLEILIILFSEGKSLASTVFGLAIIQNEIVKSAKMADFYIRLKVLEFFILDLLRTCWCFFNNINVYFYRNVKMNIDLY